MSAETFGNLIGGSRRAAASGEWFDSCNPARPSDVLGRFARSGPADVDAAVAAARAAQPGWARTPPPERGALLYRAAAILREQADAIARTIAREMGKPLREAAGHEVRSAIAMAEYMAGEGRRLVGETRPSEVDEKFAMVLREPVGVVALIAPWNLPVVTPAYKIFPALICGNAVVFKPAEDTPLAAHMLASALEQAGLPPGVLNLLTGYGPEVGPALVAHPDVAMVSFTGSTAVGRTIAELGGRTLKRVSLELGGKNAIIVMPDADIERAVEGAVRGGYGTAGQRCTASSRVIVHRSIHNTFVEALATRAQALRVADPLDPATEMGPLVNDKQLRRVAGYSEIGLAEGARLVTGGRALPELGGHFYAPTLFDRVQPGMRVAREEIFGPTVTVLSAASESEAIAIANDVPYGLSLSIFTGDVSRAFRAMRDLKAGMVYINAPTIGTEVQMPFGGVKDTGNGHREGGQAAIDQYSELKAVFVDYAAARP